MQNSLQSSIECSSVKPPVKDGRALQAFDLEGNSIRVIHYMHQVLIIICESSGRKSAIIQSQK